MSDIASDTEDIARRMPAWNPPGRSYSSEDVPDSEYLRVHALRLAEAFREVREQLQQCGRERAAAEARVKELEAALLDAANLIDHNARKHKTGSSSTHHRIVLDADKKAASAGEGA